MKISFRSFSLGAMSALLAVSLAGCGVKSLPTQKNEVDASWAEVMNQYQRRADLIPNLVNTVKGYAVHEKDTLTGVVEARAKATGVTLNADQLNDQTLAKFQAAQSQLTGALSRLMVVAEKYPELKANESFRDLSMELAGTENRIGIARRRFIEEVKNFNNLVTVFPTNLTNSVFYHYPVRPQFTAENPEAVTKPPEVKF